MSRRPGLTFYILLALVLGALVGWLRPEVGRQLQVLATIFIRLVMMIIAPLIFSTLVIGIAGSGKLRELGGMVGKALAFYLLLTMLTMALGFGIGNWLQPGQGMCPQLGISPLLRRKNPSGCDCSQRASWTRWRAATCCKSSSSPLSLPWRSALRGGAGSLCSTSAAHWPT